MLLRETSKPDQSAGAIAGRPATWVLILAAVFLSRFWWSPAYLSTDTVNLAYALESFNPKLHQPQPPGYPLFVLVARVVNAIVASPEITFWIISILVTVLSGGLLYWLASKMISPWAAMAALILFLLNPILWFARLRSPLRPWLAFFSVLVVYCAWRCWNGEKRFVWWGALALGVGSGFRPDLVAYLFPVWAVAAWKAGRSWRLIFQAGTVMAALCLAWLGAVVYAMGGLRPTAQIFSGYLSEQSVKDSILFADPESWMRPLSRLTIWNGIALAGWLWIVPFMDRRILKDSRLIFLLICVVPGLLIQVLVHIAAPGHTLFATPVWCLMGAYFISASGKHRDALLAIAGACSAALFVNVIPLGYPPSPEDGPVERAWISMRNSLAYGTFETSMDQLRWWDEMTQVSIEELSRFSVPDRPNIIIAMNGNERDFDFVNWRVLSYYLPHRPMWVLLDNLSPGSAGRIRIVRGMDMQPQQQESIVIPQSARVLWVAMPGGRFQQELEKWARVQRGRYIVYTDPPYHGPFQIDGFTFLPQ